MEVLELGFHQVFNYSDALKDVVVIFACGLRDLLLCFLEVMRHKELR